MRLVRIALAGALVVVGTLLVVRLLSIGVHPEILPGLVLGLAIAALGIYRLHLLLGMGAKR